MPSCDDDPDIIISKLKISSALNGLNLIHCCKRPLNVYSFALHPKGSNGDSIPRNYHAVHHKDPLSTQKLCPNFHFPSFPGNTTPLHRAETNAPAVCSAWCSWILQSNNRGFWGRTSLEKTFTWHYRAGNWADWGDAFQINAKVGHILGPPPPHLNLPPDAYRVQRPFVKRMCGKSRKDSRMQASAGRLPFRSFRMLFDCSSRGFAPSGLVDGLCVVS